MPLGAWHESFLCRNMHVNYRKFKTELWGNGDNNTDLQIFHDLLVATSAGKYIACLFFFITKSNSSKQYEKKKKNPLWTIFGKDTFLLGKIVQTSYLNLTILLVIRCPLQWTFQDVCGVWTG